ncbi:MAG: ribosome recycling factor [Acidobacteriota bacterium]
MVNQIINETKKKMENSLEHFKKELIKIRTGRASISILEDIHFDYYGVSTPIPQVATLQVQEPNLIIIQPWDPSVSGEIDKAIRKANIGLNPINEGKVLKVPIPPLDEERRKELAKFVKKLLEDEKTKIRLIRRESKESIKELEKEKKISEDEEYKGYDKLQELTGNYIKKAEELAEQKEKDILGE